MCVRPKFGREGGLDWGSFRATAFLRPGNKSGLQQQHHEAESNYSMDESDLIEYASQHLEIWGFQPHIAFWMWNFPDDSREGKVGEANH